MNIQIRTSEDVINLYHQMREPLTMKDLYPHEIKVSDQTINKMYMGALKNGKSNRK